MSVSVAQSKKNTEVVGPSTSATLIWTGNTANGNGVVVLVFWKTNVTITSITDSQSNTYADCGLGRVARPAGGYAQIFVAQNITGGTTPTITVNYSGGGATEIDIYGFELSGAATASAVDKYASGTATNGTTATTGNMTPDSTDGIVIAFAAGDPSSGVDVSFSDGVSYTPGPMHETYPRAQGTGYRIFTSSVGTIAVTGTWPDGITKAVVVAVVIKAAAGGTNYTRYPAESLGVTDYAAYRRVIGQMLAESIGVTDAMTRTSLYGRSLSETAGVSDVVARTALYGRVLSENIAVSDYEYAVQIFRRYLAEAAGVTDSVSSFVSYLHARVLSEALGVSDSIKATVSLLVLRIIADSVGITDYHDLRWVKVFPLSESVGITDARVNTLAYARQVAEVLGITDYDATYKQFVRNIGDTSSITDSQAYVKILVRAVAETLGVSDSVASSIVAPGVDHIVAIAESMGITDFTFIQHLLSVWISMALSIASSTAAITTKSVTAIGIKTVEPL